MGYNKKTRVFKLTESHRILYIKHLGKEPYNEIKFDCGRIIVVSYSLTYWQNILQNFCRINRSVLINPQKVISEFGSKEVELTDNTKFQFSRRKFKTVLG